MGFTTQDILTTLSYVVTVVLTYGSQAGLFGATNKDISGKNPTVATPAGWAFSIWGLIFMGQLVALIYLLIRNDESLLSSKQQVVKSVGVMWAVGWLAEAAWQFTFVQNSKLGHVVSAALLIFAGGAFQVALKRSYNIDGLSAWARQLVIAVTSVNAAWLTVAALLGILIALRSVAHVTDVPFAIGGAVFIAAYGIHVTLSRRDAFYCGTLAWAFIAIWAKHHGHAHGQGAVAWVAAFAALACITASALVVFPDSELSQQARDAEQSVHDRLVNEP